MELTDKIQLVGLSNENVLLSVSSIEQEVGLTDAMLGDLSTTEILQVDIAELSHNNSECEEG